MITVMGATGRTGRKIAETLLRAGESVRCLARAQSNLAELKGTRAEVRAGDASDTEFLAEAFRGSEAARPPARIRMDPGALERPEPDRFETGSIE